MNLGADAALRRLIDEPDHAFRPRRPLLSGNHTVRACVALADAMQLALLGLILRPAFPAAAETFSSVQAFGFGLVAALLAMVIRGAMRPSPRLGPEHVNTASRCAAIAAFLAVLLLAATCWIVLSQSVTPNPKGRSAWFLAWAIAGSFGATVVRHFAARITESLQTGQRVLVIGTPERTETVAHQLRTAPSSLWRLACTLDDRAPDALDTAVEIIAAGPVDVVVLAIDGPDAAARVAAICGRLADQPVRISLAFDMAILAGLPRVARMPFLDLADDPLSGLGGLVKRGLDIVVGGAALALLAPVMMLAALAIKLETPGPIIFRQWRFGLGSQPIEVIKLRTMHSQERDANGQRFTTTRDPRVTTVGRFLRRTSIDELPQLFNVLRGDMSLVGPRPHPLHMRVGNAYYFDVVAGYRLRHRIRPGITGWAQVNGSRGAVDTLEKAQRRVELDLYYIEAWSLWLDLRILLATALGGFLSLRAD